MEGKVSKGVGVRERIEVRVQARILGPHFDPASEIFELTTSCQATSSIQTRKFVNDLYADAANVTNE